MSETTVRQAKPQEKPYKIPDERGLVLLVHPNGSRYWRFRYSWKGKENMLALGVYPDVSLKEARMKRDEFKIMLAQGMNPADTRVKAGTTFEAIAREWFEKYMLPTRAPTHTAMIISRLERLVFPQIGAYPIKSIDAQTLLRVLRPLEARGVLETAHRVMQICGQVFRYAVARGQAERDPSADLRGALPSRKHKHHASLTEPKQVADLLRAMESFQGGVVVECALWFSLLTFARPGEVRHAEWTEFDLSGAEWRIPEDKMKMKRTHIVPLSRQTVKIVQKIKEVTGHGRYVFPSIRVIATGQVPMSENTIVAALRRMGYGKEEMCAHGFRSMASTNLNEMGWAPDVIERQLAHVEGNSVRAAYNYAEYLPERRKMMQAWADWLDDLKKLAPSN
ncbi:MAG: tyrosine-type recombinase/integrase [Synergistaceae bacterium]|nr:tyrosine-type recombinase/integrase [Synergistaceae bacterium]